MLEKIDYVIPWVNPNDELWVEDYNREAVKAGKEIKSSDERFRDFGILKYQFRSIEMFAPWINKVFLLVHSSSQIPDWMNRENLVIIKHKNFIPEEFLPCFNSNTIDMFLGNIPNLSEKFIYSNDDCLFNSPVVPEDFFEGDKVKSFMTKKRELNTDFQRVTKRSYDIVKKDNNGKRCLPEGVWLRPSHSQLPMLKSSCREVLKNHIVTIFNSISTFRDETKNFNQYMYSCYNVIMDKQVQGQKISGYYNYSSKERAAIAAEELSNPTRKLVCLNDTENTQDEFVSLIDNILSEKFPVKSKFEV